MLNKTILADTELFKFFNTLLIDLISPIKLISKSSLNDSILKLLKGLRLILPGR